MHMNKIDVVELHAELPGCSSARHRAVVERTFSLSIREMESGRGTVLGNLELCLGNARWSSLAPWRHSGTGLTRRPTEPGYLNPRGMPVAFDPKSPPQSFDIFTIASPGHHWLDKVRLKDVASLHTTGYRLSV
jgi:hypothetical protein